MRPNYLLIALGVAGAAVAPDRALAQTDSLIVTPTVPTGYDRGRNVSVTERARPDYDPLGIRSGGFLIYPRVDVGVGFSDNIYLSEADDPTADFFAETSASVATGSDWSRHQLGAQLSGTLRRFAENPRRNEQFWRSAVQGRADLGTAISVTAEAQAGKVYESPFSGEVDATIASLSSYNYAMGGIRAQHAEGRTRYVLAYNINKYAFNPVELTNTTTIDQSGRDRLVQGVVGQAEYAFSPSMSVYGQLSYARTDYDERVVGGQPSPTSDGYRVLGGISMDLPAFLRGTVGIGYSFRKFDSPSYRDIDGLSVEARLEYFYSELTTVTFAARRLLQDSTLFSNSAFFDNRVSLGVDHELLRNLILNVSGEFSRQDYVDSDRNNDVYRVSTRANYLVSRSISTNLSFSYSGRVRHGTGNTGSLDEFRGLLSVSLRR